MTSQNGKGMDVLISPSTAAKLEKMAAATRKTNNEIVELLICNEVERLGLLDQEKRSKIPPVN